MNIVTNNIVIVIVIIVVIIIVIIIVIITRAFAKLLCLCCPGRCLSRLWTKWKRRLEEEKKVSYLSMFLEEEKKVRLATVNEKNLIWKQNMIMTVL